MHYHYAKPPHNTGLSAAVGTVNYDGNVVVTCEIKLFQNYFSLRRRPTEMILFQHVETCLKLS